MNDKGLTKHCKCPYHRREACLYTQESKRRHNKHRIEYFGNKSLDIFFKLNMLPAHNNTIIPVQSEKTQILQKISLPATDETPNQNSSPPIGCFSCPFRSECNSYLDMGVPYMFHTHK